MSWKPEVYVKGDGWCGNGLVFATEEEAKAWADHRLMVWFVPTDARAVEVDSEKYPPNYTYLVGEDGYRHMISLDTKQEV